MSQKLVISLFIVNKVFTYFLEVTQPWVNALIPSLLWSSCGIPEKWMSVVLGKMRGGGNDCPVVQLWHSAGWPGIDPRVWKGDNPKISSLPPAKSTFWEGSLSLTRMIPPAYPLFKPRPQLAADGFIEAAHGEVTADFVLYPSRLPSSALRPDTNQDNTLPGTSQ